MKRRTYVLALLLVTGAVHAQSALTVRPTELQAQPKSDAATLASLLENSKVEVLRRSGAWSEVKTANSQTGWVRMLSLRFDAGGRAQASSTQNSANPLGALTGLLSSGRTSNSATVTTGVRGLSEEDLQNAQANPAELQRAREFAADRSKAQVFAQRTKLSPATIDYLPEPAPVHKHTQPGSEGG